MIYLFSFFIIIILTFTNALTDSSNIVTTVVTTRVISFRKATNISSIFCFLGIVAMCYISFSLANCMSNIITIQDGKQGIIMLTASMVSVIIVSLASLYFGIPTSETHGLIAGMTGASIAFYNFNNINFEEWENVIIGIVLSICGTYLIAIIIEKYLKKLIKKFNEKDIKKMQLLSCFGMSFVYGAQEGQKFIGILILFFSVIFNNTNRISGNPNEYIWIIFLVAITMSLGVKIGGRRIVDNLGRNMIKLENIEGLLSDVTTIITLFIATILGLPVSTTHVKTMSMIGVGRQNNMKLDKNVAKNIFRVWIYTFPICGIISYILCELGIIIIN